MTEITPNKVRNLVRRKFLKLCAYASFAPAYLASSTAMAWGHDFTLYSDSKKVRVEVGRDGTRIKCRVMKSKGGRWTNVQDVLVLVRKHGGGKFDEKETNSSGRTEHEIGASKGMQVDVGVPGLIRAQTGSVT